MPDPSDRTGPSDAPLDARSALYYSVNGSSFSPAALTLYTEDNLSVSGTTALVDGQHYETVHETFHWLTSLYTTAGRFLSLLRYARLKLTLDLMNRIGVEQFNAKLAAGFDPGELPDLRFRQALGPLARAGDGLSVEAHNALLLHAFEKLYLRASRTLPHFKANQPMLHPVGLAVPAAGLASFEARRWDQGGGGIHPDGFHMDGFVEQALTEAFQRQFGFAREKNGDAVDTIDLFEAFSVIADICAAMAVGDKVAGFRRLGDLHGSRYLHGIRAICAQLGIALQPADIARWQPTLFSILEVALNPPIPPFSVEEVERLTWARFYPPLRAILSTVTARKMEDRPEQGCTSGDVDRFQNHLYSVIDGKPPVHGPASRPGQLAFFDRSCHNQERDGEGSPAPLRWDWYDLITELSSRVREDMAEVGAASLSAVHAKGALKTLRHAFAPTIILPSGDLLYTNKTTKEKAIEWSTLMGTWYVLDDLARGRRRVRVLPRHTPAMAGKAWFVETAEAVRRQYDRLGIDLEMAV